MSVSSVKSDKVDKYINKYQNMTDQLDEINNKMDRLVEDIKDVEDKFVDKHNKLKDTYQTKITYYKKCIEECQNKYNRELEENAKKMSDKSDKLKKEFDKSKAYKEIIKNNIKNLVTKAKEDNVDLE